MSANILDKATDAYNSANPNSARVAGFRSIGGTTLSCDNLSGWPTASAVHFATYKLDTSGKKIAGSQTDWKGIVSSNNITSLTYKGGTADAGNAIGDVVEMMPTASWAHDLFTGFTNQHSQLDGSHKGITTDTLTASGAITANGSITGTGFSAGTLFNPYKASVYNSSGTIIAAGAGGAFGALTKVAFQTELFDTGANFDSATNYRFTAPISGFYRVSAQTTAFVLNGIIVQSSLYKNGTAGTLLKSSPQLINATGVSNFVTGSINGLVQLAANDYLEVYIRTTQTTTANTTTGQDNTFFDIALVSQT